MIEVLQNRRQDIFELVEINDEAVLSHITLNHHLHLVGVSVQSGALALIAGQAVSGVKLCDHSELHSWARPLRRSISSN